MNEQVSENRHSLKRRLVFSKFLVKASVNFENVIFSIQKEKLFLCCSQLGQDSKISSYSSRYQSRRKQRTNPLFCSEYFITGDHSLCFEHNTFSVTPEKARKMNLLRALVLKTEVRQSPPATSKRWSCVVSKALFVREDGKTLVPYRSENAFFYDATCLRLDEARNKEATDADIKRDFRR